MTSVTSQLIQEVTAHAQSDSLEDAREICADGTYFPNNLRISDINRRSERRFTFTVICCLKLDSISRKMKRTHD